jgi:ATP-dependent Lon protease
MSKELSDVVEVPVLALKDVVEVPVLALRDVVVYPQMVIPLFVGREKSIRCLDIAMEKDKQVFLVAQKDAAIDDPQADDVYQTGTVATILQMLKLPDGTVKVLVEGVQRAKVVDFVETVEYFSANVEFVSQSTEENAEENEDIDVLIRSAISQFEGYVKLNKKIPPEVLTSVSGIDDAEQLADTMAAHMPLKLAEKQKVLEIIDVNVRLEHLMTLMEGEIDLLQVEKKIRTRVKKQMEKSQREYYLNEQMKAIQKEMGELEDVPSEAEELRQRIDEAGMSKEAKEKASSELNKLKLMSPMSSEASVVRTYLDWMVNVPWKKRSKVRLDLTKAEEILENDHYGLKEVKERILEYLAVQKRVKKLKGPILCLVGPPGVGKTSLGESIARATNQTENWPLKFFNPFLDCKIFEDTFFNLFQPVVVVFQNLLSLG